MDIVKRKVSIFQKPITNISTFKISTIRLINQQIAGIRFNTAGAIVRWMGAMQAQDFPMAKWALGIRLPGSTERRIENAVNTSEIIRTHLMRPTWHFVSADDIYWMLELTAPQIKSSIRSRHTQLELTAKIITQSHSIIEKALTKEGNLTREEIAEELTKAKIKTDNNRLSHLLARAELDGIICSGVIKGNKQTYALLPARVPRKKILSREESLAELAKRYFSSHGPATLHDFIWWSGLSVSAARQALESVKSRLNSETINSEIYWYANSFSPNRFAKTSLYLLPAFDEFLIGYKDRSAALSKTNNKKTVSNNGIFRPVIVINGLVQGIWKRTIEKDKVIIEATFFQSPDHATKNQLEKTAAIFGRFLNKEASIEYH